MGIELQTPRLDLDAVRAQFPALNLSAGGRQAVFLDNPAGTQVPQRVLDRVAEYWRTMNANHGGAFLTSRRSDELVERVREHAAAFVNARSAQEIVFGPNMTSLTFALSRAIAREVNPGDEIVVTRLEHDANLSPWLALEERGIKVRFADLVVDGCRLDMQDLASKVGPRTRLLAVTHASNAVGTIPDLHAVSRLARQVGAWLWVDAVHYAPHGPIDVRRIDCDFLTCSAYKFYGPHLGLLYGRREVLERLRPYKVRPAPETVPQSFETGTPAFESIAGLEGTFEYLAWLGEGTAPDRQAFERAFRRIQEHERELVTRLLSGLRRTPGIRIHGIEDPAGAAERAPTVSVTWPPHSPQRLAAWLAQHQVFAWHGNHYAPVLMERLALGEEGTLRIGLAHYNTAQEVDLALELLAGYRPD
jgi:cysteine desulfurase family protein (TIGR01976 family)